MCDCAGPRVSGPLRLLRHRREPTVPPASIRTVARKKRCAEQQHSYPDRNRNGLHVGHTPAADERSDRAKMCGNQITWRYELELTEL